MAKSMSKSDAAARVREMFPAFLEERRRLDRIDRWYRWDHDKPHRPRTSTVEYRELADRAYTPWLGLVVTNVAQSLYVEGYRRARDAENATAWGYWQANGLDSRQTAIHRAALAYGRSYAKVLPGTAPLTGARMPVIRGVSPRRMMTFWADPAADDFPMFALQADPAKVNGSAGWAVQLLDDVDVHYLNVDSDGTSIDWIENRSHDAGVCPVVRYANLLDLEGRTDGEVEPFIPIAARIDQTTFDRLVIQRFAAWVVRTISGMTLPDTVEGQTVAKLRLAAENVLVAKDSETKFGSLPASPLDGLIAAKETDVRDLAAVTQTPPHNLLGQMINLSAEALAAADAASNRKIEERKHGYGESHELTLRLAAHVMGDRDGAADTEAQVRWRDMESRSLAQTADALGKLATMLGVPVEALWERIPGVTDQDIERWKQMAEQEGGLNALMRELVDAQTPPGGGGGPGPPAA